MISSGKGVGIDCIPDSIPDTKDLDIMRKLTEFVNLVFRRRLVPSPFRFSRLHLINKLKVGVPELDDLRPIMISSPLIKLIEAIALCNLREVLEPLIHSAQVGFLSGLSTQTQILRLIGEILDRKGSPGFNSGAWFILFIDFKAAFDRVDHDILFKKLETSGVECRTINIVKLLYNSYNFTLPDGTPHKINSGVAQRSLISPILYDWYVNDLVTTLSKKFGNQSTYPTLTT